MGIELLEHNQEAYENVKRIYETKTRAAVIHPTGSGKSFIALKLMKENKGKKILYLSPSVEILHQLKRDIFANGLDMRDFRGLKRMTYQKLVGMRDEDIEALNADIIVLDEFHHLGAPMWGTAVDTLLEANPEAKVLGLSATPMRYNDGDEVRDMTEELLYNNVASEITLEEAIERGILSAPEYVTGLYEYEKITEDLERKIGSCQDREMREVATRELAQLKKMLQEAVTSLPDLFESTMKNKTGKYIVYCRNIEDMYKKMEMAKELFSKVNSDMKILHMSSDSNIRHNDATIKEFESENDPSKLKLLFSVNMLNEGYHIKDLDGVIMMRPTYSPTLYTQQLGRALSVGTSKKPVVIDLVNNIDSIKIMENFFRNLGTKAVDKDNIKNPNISANFRITEQIRNVKNLVEKIDSLVSRNQSLSYEEKLEIMKRYMDETGENISKFTIFEGYSIGSWQTRIRGLYKKNSLEISDDLLEEYKRFGIVPVPAYLRNVRAIKEWMNKNDSNRVPSRVSKNEEEKKLGIAWWNIRQYLIKPYIALETEEERIEYKRKRPELEGVMSIVGEIDSKNIPTHLRKAREIKKWMDQNERMRPPAQQSKDEEERKLGVALNTIRQYLIKPYIALETEKERIEYKRKRPELEEVMSIVGEIDSKNIPTHLRKAREIKKWMDQNERMRPPAHRSKDEEERKLGAALNSIRQYLIKPYIALETDEERIEYEENHAELEEVVHIVADIENQDTVKRRGAPRVMLASLITEYWEKRAKLREAKELETQYAKLLADKDVKQEKKGESYGE